MKINVSFFLNSIKWIFISVKRFSLHIYSVNICEHKYILVVLFFSFIRYYKLLFLYIDIAINYYIL